MMKYIPCGVSRLNRLKQGAVAIVIVAALTALPTTSSAEWRLSPRVSAIVTATDNVDVSPSDEDADLVATTTAGFTLRGDGARSQTSLSSSVSYDKYVDRTDLDGYRVNLLGVSNTELLQDRFFVDIRGAISEVSLRRNQGTSATDRSLSGDRSRIYNYSVSPNYVQRIGDHAIATLLYRYSQTIYDDTDVGDASTAPDDEVSHFGRLSISNGPDAGRVGITANLEYEQTDRDNTADLDSATADINFSYILNTQLTFLASVGYDNFDYKELDTKDLGNGFLYAGFRYLPGPNTDITLQAGRRYDDPYYFADARHTFSGGATIAASFVMDVQTQSQALSDQLGGLEIDENGDVVDPFDQQPLDPNSQDLDFVNAPLLKTKRFNLSLIIPRLRNTYSIRAGLFQREDPFDINEDEDEDKVATVSGFFSRALTPVRTANASLTYSEAFDSLAGNGDDRSIKAQLSVSEQLGPSINGQLSYSMRHSEGDQNDDTLENALTLSVNINF